MLGDYAAYVVATGQAEGARRRRAEWTDREAANGHLQETPR